MVLEAIFKLTDSYTSTLKKISANTENFAKSLDKSSSGVDKLGTKLKSVNSLESGFGKLVGTVVTLGAVLGALKLSDDISNANARLSMITSNLSEQKDLQAKIMASAKSSRSSYIEMANATSKMKMLAPDSFKSNEEALKFTETLQKSLTVSGADKASKDGAFLQITQAMTSGRLQGDEFRSMTENAPMVADAIAKYMGKPKAELKELSSKGLITADIVKNALFSASDDINKKFETMPKTFNDVMTEFKNNFIQVFEPISAKITQILGSESITKVINAIGVALLIGANILGFFVDGIAFLIDNLDILTPALLGVAGAMLVYNATSGIAYLQTISNAIALGTKAIADAFEYVQIIALIAAQDGFNAALAACPITWIITGIIALIAIVYVVIAVINKVAGTTISATGVILGAVFALGSGFYNHFVFIWNIVAAFVNFFANCFNNPIASVKILFLDLARNVIDTVATMVRSIENLINMIPGVHVNISSGITNFSKGISGEIDRIKKDSGYKDVMGSMKQVSLGEAYKSGYNIGKGIENKVGSMFKGLKGNGVPNLDSGAGDSPLPSLGTSGNPTNVKGSGKGGAVKVENSEDLELLRSLAMRDYVARVSQNTLAPNINIEFSGDIHKETDTDNVLSHINNELRDILAVATEG